MLDKSSIEKGSFGNVHSWINVVLERYENILSITKAFYIHVGNTIIEIIMCACP